MDDTPVAAQRVVTSGHRLGGAQLWQRIARSAVAVVLISIFILAVSVDRERRCRYYKRTSADADHAPYTPPGS
jgi:hypothetical protein